MPEAGTGYCAGAWFSLRLGKLRRSAIAVGCQFLQQARQTIGRFVAQRNEPSRKYPAWLASRPDRVRKRAPDRNGSRTLNPRWVAFADAASGSAASPDPARIAAEMGERSIVKFSPVSSPAGHENFTPGPNRTRRHPSGPSAARQVNLKKRTPELDRADLKLRNLLAG